MVKIYCKECRYCEYVDDWGSSYWCNNKSKLQKDTIGNFEPTRCSKINIDFKCDGFSQKISIWKILLGGLNGR